VIVWINGAFGVGKTTVAKRLVAELPHAGLFDPEWLGFLIQRLSREGRRAADFQDVPAWRAWTVRSVLVAARFYEHLVVPMTLVERNYFDEIVGTLRKRAELRHFTLIAPSEVIRARVRARGEHEMWCEAQLPRCVAALAEAHFAEAIATDGRDVEQVVAEIRGRLARPAQLPAASKQSRKKGLA